MNLTKAVKGLRREKEKLEQVIPSLDELQATGSVQELRRAKERLERVIASLEKLQATGRVPARGRRGRRPMSLEERREVSARMKRYWEARHNQRRPWS